MPPMLGSIEYAEQTLRIWEEQKRWREAEARGDDLALLAKELRWAADTGAQYLKPLAVSEIADAFKDEAPALCRRHIRIYTRVINEWMNLARVIKNNWQDPNQFWQIAVLRFKYPEFADRQRRVLKSILSATTVKPALAGGIVESISEQDVQMARDVSIEGLYDWEKPKTVAGRFRACCPFHSEKSGSFFIFKDNKFRCFGCAEHGDAIDFVMKTMNFEFLKAVKYLIRK